MKIQWKGSPNKNDASHRKPIDRVVIHWFGIGDLDSANNRFQSPTGGASAHYGISDDTVFQWVKEEDVSWHCGNWPMNQRSIGIEHDATTTKNATEKTYQTAGKLLADICKRNNIPLDRTHIIGHNEVKATQCPGTLDIDKIIKLAKEDSMNLEVDIPTEVEDRFKLKEVDRYDKYWTYTQLIEDWVKLTKEVDYEKGEKDKYKKEARELRQVTKSQAEEIAKFNKEIESLSKANATQYAEIQSLQGQFADVSRERDSLIDVNKDYRNALEKCRAEEQRLSDLVASQNPIAEYKTAELLSEIFNRFFNLFKGGA
jgi:hypothetical protein